MSPSRNADSPPAGGASRSTAMSALPDSKIFPSQGPLVRGLRPLSGIIEPPSDDHAAAIDLAADPPPLILRVVMDGSTPMCLQAETKPKPSVLVPDQEPPALIIWFTASTPLGLLMPNPDGAECFRGEVHETHISPVSYTHLRAHET